VRSLPLSVRAVGLFVASAVWLMVISALLDSEGLDAEGVARAFQVASATVLGLVWLELGLARRRPALALAALAVVAAGISLLLDLVLTQLDLRSVVVATGYAVIAVAVVGGEAWWARSGRRGLDATG